jgi:hypothetical protein
MRLVLNLLLPKQLLQMLLLVWLLWLRRQNILLMPRLIVSILQLQQNWNGTTKDLHKFQWNKLISKAN